MLVITMLLCCGSRTISRACSYNCTMVVINDVNKQMYEHFLHWHHSTYYLLLKEQQVLQKISQKMSLGKIGPNQCLCCTLISTLKTKGYTDWFQKHCYQQKKSSYSFLLRQSINKIFNLNKCLLIYASMYFFDCPLKIITTTNQCYFSQDSL